MAGAVSELLEDATEKMAAVGTGVGAFSFAGSGVGGRQHDVGHGKEDGRVCSVQKSVSIEMSLEGERGVRVV